MLNPYASFLEDRDPLQVISESPDRLSSLVQTLGPEGLERSLAPEKWSAREILCHLADCEIVFAFRLRQALAEEHHTIQPFDQDAWASAYAGLDAHGALAVFTSVRKWNIRLMETVPQKAFDRTVTHPERGTMTFRTIVETMGGHDLNHCRQLDAIASQATTA